MQPIATADVLALNEQFTRAVEQRDVAAMGRVWSTRPPVLCLHVGGRLLTTREDVLASWTSIFRQSRYIETELLEMVAIDTVADMAWLTTVDRVRAALPEGLVGGDVLTTKVLRAEDGGLRLCAHHAAEYR